MLTSEDFAKLDDIYMRSETAKEIFVRKDDCNAKHEDINKEIADMTVALAKTNSQLSILVKICSATLGTCGTAIIAAIMRLILN